MVIKVEMYTVECDNCKKTSGQDSEYSCWNDEQYALEEAEDSGWVKHEDKTYCPDCHSIDDDDEDNVIIKEIQNK